MGMFFSECATDNYVTRQTTVEFREERRLRRTVSGHCGNKKRVSRIDGYRVRQNYLTVSNLRGPRHRCHWDSRHRNQSYDWRTNFDFAVRIGTRTGSRPPIDVQLRSRFKDIVRAPQTPHALGKMRIEVAMEDGIAHNLIAIATTVVGHFQRKGGAGANRLAVVVTGIVTISRVHPLVRVLVMDVVFLDSAVQNAELGMVADIAVINVRRIIRIKCFCGLGALDNVAWASRVLAGISTTIAGSPT